MIIVIPVRVFDFPTNDPVSKRSLTLFGAMCKQHVYNYGLHLPYRINLLNKDEVKLFNFGYLCARLVHIFRKGRKVSD